MEKLQVKILGENAIKKIIRLSLGVFRESSSDPYHDPDKWKECLKDGGLLLGAFLKNKLVGYIFGYSISRDEFHLWMGGVDKEFRGKGIMSKLLDKSEKWAKKHGYKAVTANTYKSKFPAMFYLLNKRGFEIYKQKSINSGKRKSIKSYWRKTF